jgi:flagellar basal body rod protein FlgG
MFSRDGAFIVNEKGKVMDISGGLDRENQNIQIYNKHGRINQQFDVIYEDEWKEEPVKGELNKKFGLYVERPFYVVT